MTWANIRLDERERLRGALAAVAAGRGGGVWVSGGPGIGKSHLLAGVRAGVDVGWATAPTRPEPLVSVRACIDDAARGRPDLAGVTALLGPPADGDPAVEMPGLRTLLRRIRDAVRHRPLILVLDDLHRADDASLAVWSRLHRVAATGPLLLVAAGRPTARPGLGAVHADLAARGVTTINLEPLPDQEATSLAHGFGHHPYVVSGAVRDAGGNPAYLWHLAGGRGEPPPVLHALVADHLSTLTDRARRAVRLLALAPPGLPAVGLAARNRLPLDRLRQDLGEATGAAILTSSGDVFGFRHPIVRRVLRVPSMRQASRPAAGRSVEGVEEGEDARGGGRNQEQTRHRTSAGTQRRDGSDDQKSQPIQGSTCPSCSSRSRVAVAGRER